MAKRKTTQRGKAGPGRGAGKGGVRRQVQAKPSGPLPPEPPAARPHGVERYNPDELIEYRGTQPPQDEQAAEQVDQTGLEEDEEEEQEARGTMPPPQQPPPARPARWGRI